ncbi:hypothetical protein AB0J21_27140 [Streptomyces sp. NPDC049954]|uniref:hypothetical protein n=1 Tax=Streptomyces sp. NPDC049954 TaxID=3155779 RepID=UPI00342F31BE
MGSSPTDRTSFPGQKPRPACCIDATSPHPLRTWPVSRARNALCHLSPVPKNAWRWVDTAQYKLTQRAQHRSAGAVDLLVCATAVRHGHTVLHVDNDVATVAAVLKEVQQRDVRT